MANVNMPKTIGKYRVLAPLGSGGMATVFLAEVPETRRKVAVKRLDAEEAENVIRFRREAEILQQITHPNVVKVFDFDPGPPAFYAMAYLDAQPLDEMLDAGKAFSGEEVIGFLRDMAGGLGCIHGRGVIHRDMKPSNVLMDGKRAVITDFGIAHDSGATEITRTGSFLGTPLYLSPEQIRRLNVDERSDLYQVGLMGYKMLTGLVPFENEEMVVMTSKRLTEDPDPPSKYNPTIDPNLEQVILRLIAIDVGHRYKDAKALEEDLDRISRGERPAVRTTIRIKKKLPAFTGDQAAAPGIPAAGIGIAFGVILGIAAAVHFGGGGKDSATDQVGLKLGGLVISSSDRRVRLRFRTKRRLATSIRYGASRNLGRIATVSAEPSIDHEIRLEDLDPKRMFYYKVIGLDEKKRQTETTVEPLNLLTGRGFPITELALEPADGMLKVSITTGQECQARIFLGPSRRLLKARALSPKFTKVHKGNYGLPDDASICYFKLEFMGKDGKIFPTAVHSFDVR